MPRYNPAEIEPKWQAYWEQNETFKTPELPEGEKLYVLDMFPYPSGDGLHVGHPEGYTATDITCRFERMRGKTVLHPMGFDAFGLPAEEHAIATNTPPRVSTEKNIDNFRRQLKMLGFSYDWAREIATTDVDYFRWTQWIFLVLYDTWFDAEQQRGRAIDELPIPADVAAEGERAVRRYQDENRLAYQADALVNWCPKLGTVLANEEVQDGRSDRGGHPVERRPLRQWMLRITAYGDRLENDLESLDWSPGIKKLQSDWIGRSTGAEVDFYVGNVDDAGKGQADKGQFDDWKRDRAATGFPKHAGDDVLRIYTTRPDTLYGATYMVIAPEHPFAERLTTAEQQQAVESYRAAAASKSDRERTENAKEKTGVFTGSHAINPVNCEPVPVYIADYVLISYGTGAIMAVPAHDTRDFEFAQAYDIPIVAVVEPGEEYRGDRQAVLDGKECFAGVGTAVNSGDYNGASTTDFKVSIGTALTEQGVGMEAVNYKLRDWLFSRQRFWGEPFPILHELDDNGAPTGAVRAVPLEDLPVNLPEVEDYKPHGRPEPPLGKAPEEWLYPTIDGVRYRREINTMPQWAGSCWYYLRFIDPTNKDQFVSHEKEKAWMPVDLYVGGAEHAVLHLLYSRFWHKVLYDRGHVSTTEPFQRLVNQGMILGDVEFTAYKTADGGWTEKSVEGSVEVKLSEEDVEKKGEGFVLAEAPSVKVDSRAHKMSKSRGNVVNPDDVVREYGADALRIYEMFMGPLEATKPWSMNGVNGVRGFLDRAWRMVVDQEAETVELNGTIADDALTDDQLKVLHKTIKAVTVDTADMRFNTAVARMMEFVNYFTKSATRPRTAMNQFALLLSPYAPHLAEELWQILGNDGSLAYAPWPEYDEALTVDDTVEIPVQVNGKIKAKIAVSADTDRAALERAAREDEKIVEILSGSNVVKVVVVPGRLVNFVVKG
jgi:leucyl-tRNA synthetase